MFQIRGLLRRQRRLQKTDGIPELAFNEEFVLQGRNNEIGTSRTASDEDLTDGFVLLMLEEIDRGAQLAAERNDQGFELGLNLARHAHLNAFGFGITDAQGFGEAIGEPVPADSNDPAQDQFTLLKQANGGVFEADVDEGNHILQEYLRHGHFEGVDRTDQARDDMVGDEAGVLDGGLDILEVLAAGAGDQDFVFVALS